MSIELTKSGGRWLDPSGNIWTLSDEDSHKLSPGDESFWPYVAVCVGLVFLGGISSGLNLGLLSLNEFKLHLISKSGTEVEKSRVKGLKPVLSNHHRLLVTLLVVNAACMEALPIFLDRLVPSFVAIIISVTAVLFVGEIIPQALCSRDPLYFGSLFAWLVRFFIFILTPIVWPISKFLDCCIGHEFERTVFSRGELHEVIKMHTKPEAYRIIEGCMNFKDKRVADAMVKWDKVQCLPGETKLSQTVGTLKHSRYPVSHGSPDNIQWLALTKKFIHVDPDGEKTVAELVHKKPHVVHPDRTLFSTLKLFRRIQSHMLLVSEQARSIRTLLRQNKPLPPEHKFMGIITLEDLLEEILQLEILDEFDLNMRSRIVINRVVRRFFELRDRARRKRGEMNLSRALSEPRAGSGQYAFHVNPESFIGEIGSNSQFDLLPARDSSLFSNLSSVKTQNSSGYHWNKSTKSVNSNRSNRGLDGSGPIRTDMQEIDEKTPLMRDVQQV